MSSWHQALISFTKRSRSLAVVGPNHHNFLLGGWPAPKEINLLPGIGQGPRRAGFMATPLS